MSEKETKIEMKEDEREMVDHWSHEHPLTLVGTHEGDYCYGCEVLFGSGEQAYGCSINGCEYSDLLHEECAAMAREIRFPLHHPQHILIQRLDSDLFGCSICGKMIWSIGYECTECEFQMHLRCAQSNDLIDAAAALDDDEQRRAIIHHPSHPNHKLKLWRKRCSFKCDACGISCRDSSYACTADACQYWIHEKCASLPQNMKREDHHHSLYLSFYVPQEYIRFNYKCDVCSISFLPNYWIYHCPICRYIVHVKCSFDRPPPARVTENEEGVIHLPVKVVVEELITPFVMRERGGTTLKPPIISIPNDEDELVKENYEFCHHRHQLTLVSSDHQNQEEEEEEDEENYGVISKLICDGCNTPISKHYYMSCSECKYNLHMACFHLPPCLPSLPLHQQQHDDDDDGHHLLLRSCDKLQPWKWEYCNVCLYRMNGLFYACGKCNFKVDIECASMTGTIRHAAHPQHLLKHVAQPDLKRDANSWRFRCAAGCGYVIDNYDCYRCCTTSCNFIVHVRCAVLPASVSSRRWDERHLLLLTYDATLNRPGKFYCDQCETRMNPKSWMYRCRDCDLSFHPKCFKNVSGLWRHIKLGQRYVTNDAIHPHRLTYQLLTKKRRCDICRYNKYEWDGFYCASCNFFICHDECGAKMIKAGDMKAVDLID